MQSQARGWLVLTLFFCSGATALVYEVVWSKFLSQMFGSSVYAQTVVLAVFMGGLALGNRLFGRWADRSDRPVRAYGMLEIGIGIYAVLFPILDKACDRIFIAIGSGIVEHAVLLLALKGILSVILLLGPTILMGGTLPLLAAWLQKSSSDAGRRSARFYSVNSLGAVAGSAIAGFWLVQRFGLIATLQLTALANIVVGTIAMLIGDESGSGEKSATSPAIEPVTVEPQTLRLTGWIVAVTGATSMGFEVLASRSLGLIFGSSLQTFAVVLIAFILGIGLGSAWVASPRRVGISAEKLIVVLLCVSAGWVVLLVFNIERWVDVYRIAVIGLARTPAGYVYHQLLATGMSLVILGLPAMCIGAVLPLVIRMESSEGASLGAKVGRLLTWNTLGAVIGVLFTGFILMPFVGLRNAFGVLALLLALMALMLSLRRGVRLATFLPLGIVASVLCLFFIGNESWRHVMGTGIFRLREPVFQAEFMSLLKKHVKILFYEDGPDATVSVEHVDEFFGSNLGLRINGKPDAGTSLNLNPQLMAAHLPMLAKPDAKDVFVLGLGCGMTPGAVLAYPVDQVVVAENCEPVIRAAKLFEDWNYHVLDDPRTHVWCEDARTVLKLRPQMYDVIITVPSNPWTVGMGSVFSRDYYEIAASRLKPGGIVCAWFHVYEMQEDIVRLMLRTFSSVFPYTEIWDCGSDIMVLGSMQPWATGPEVFQKGFAIDRVRTDFFMVDIQSPEALMAKQLASQRTAFAIPGDGPVQTDLFPILEYAAPRAFFIGSGTSMLERYDERTRQQLLAPREKRETLHSLPIQKAQLAFNMFSTINEELSACLFNAPAATGVPCVFNTPQPSPPASSDQSIIAAAARAFDGGDIEQAKQLITAALQRNPGDEQAAYLARIIERERPPTKSTATLAR